MAAGIRAIITLDKELYEEIKVLSKKEERSFSNQVVYLVKKGKEKSKSRELE